MALIEMAQGGLFHPLHLCLLLLRLKTRFSQKEEHERKRNKSFRNLFNHHMNQSLKSKNSNNPMQASLPNC
jgi:hypothetical protein